MKNITLNADRLFESVVDGIMIIDVDGEILAVNQAIYNMFGFKNGELVGKNVSIIMPNPHKKAHDAYVKSYLKTKKAKIVGIGRDVIAQRKDKSLFPIRLAVSQIEDQGKQLFIGIIQDITELKVAEEQINQLNANLEETVERRTTDLARAVDQLSKSNVNLAKEIVEREKTEKALRQSEQRLLASLKKERSLNEMKNRFLSMASHEFRTPLATILSSADIIEAYTNDLQQTNRLKHTRRIKSSVNNLTHILNDFLSSARLDSGAIDILITSFGLKAFFKDVIDKTEGYIKKGQKIICSYQEQETSDIIYTDKHYLENILNNLLSNAVKYSSEDQNIYCKIILNESLSVSIEDNGIGIPQKEKEFLFSRFFRASNVENIRGTGLGLSITKQYIELLGGNISLKSEEGKGTTVLFSIPISIPQ